MPKQHTHSQSLSLGSDAVATAECAESFGILEAVQQYTHLHHAFAGSHRPQHILEDVELTTCPPTPRLTHRNSSASTVSVPSVLDDVPSPSHPTVFMHTAYSRAFVCMQPQSCALSL